MSLIAEGLAVGGDLLVDLARTIVLAIAAATAGVVAGLIHRWYAGERVPDGLAVLVGLSVVAIYLNTAGALGEVIGGELELLALDAVVFNTVTFFIAGIAAVAGGRIGDRIGGEPENQASHSPAPPARPRRSLSLSALRASSRVSILSCRSRASERPAASVDNILVRLGVCRRRRRPHTGGRRRRQRSHRLVSTPIARRASRG